MVLKKFLIGVVCFLISLGLLGYISSDMLLYFSDKNFIKSVFEKKITENIDNESLEMLSSGCLISPSLGITIQDINFTCFEFMGKNSSQIIEYISQKVVSKLYQREFDCELINCLREGKYDVIFSEKANAFFKKMKIYSIYAVIGLVLILLLLTRNFISWSRKLGYTLLFTALPLYVFNYFTPGMIENIVPQETKEFIPLITQKLYSSNELLLVISIAGFSLFIISYVLEEFKKRRES